MFKKMIMYEEHVYDMFCEVNVSYSIQRNAHKDNLIFWHLPHYYNTMTLFKLFRGINITTLITSSHNKFCTVITTNHPLTTKNECTHSADPSPQVWRGNRNNNWQENNCRDNTDLTILYNNYYDNYNIICACMCVLYNIYNLHLLIYEWETFPIHSIQEEVIVMMREVVICTITV